VLRVGRWGYRSVDHLEAAPECCPTRLVSSARSSGRRARVSPDVACIYGVGFLVLAIVAGILAGEAGIVVVFALVYGLTVVIARWGKRWVVQEINNR